MPRRKNKRTCRWKEHLIWTEVIWLLYATGVYSNGSKIQERVRNGEKTPLQQLQMKRS